MDGGGGGGWAGLIAQGAKDTWSNAWGTYSAYQANELENAQHDQWNTQMNQQTKQFDQNMDYKYQREVNDLKAAGLNPMLAVAHGASPSPSASAPGVYTPVGLNAPVEAWSMARRAESESQLSSAAVAKTNAEAKLAEAQAGEVEARTPTYAVSMDKLRQDIAESLQRVDTLAATAGRESASAAELSQRAENLRAQLPQIKATVKMLQATTAEKLQAAGLSAARIQEVMQIVRQNLPQVQCSIMQLEQMTKQADLPGHAQMGEFQTNSILAPVGAMLKSLSPLIGLMR